MDEIVLVLGGGGARGLAHIGVIRAIEEAGLRVRAVAGCSMGGIVGAFLAAGHDAEAIEAVAAEIRYEKLLSFGELGGIVGGDGIASLLSARLPARFEELDLPLLVTAVDVQEGELVVLNEGPLVPALRATSALPGLLSPVEHQGRYLVDGGLLNNLPTDLARTLGACPVVAVDVAAPPGRPLRFQDERSLYARLKDVLQPHRALTVELFMKAFDVPQAVVTQMRLAMAPPDLLIRPTLERDFGIEQFGRRKEAIEAGHTAASEALATFTEAPAPEVP
ncbi:MAG: patatin-like phospholipase family protein [Trueperaceae bacterium]